MLSPFLNTAIIAIRKAASPLVKMLADPNRQQQDIEKIIQNIENSIAFNLHKAYPQHCILHHTDPIKFNAQYTWIVKPLSGKINFLHGIPLIASGLALAIESKIHYAAIYNPCTDELFTATRAAGAYLNQYRLRASQQAHIEKAIVATDNKNVYPQSRQLGANLLNLAYTSAGRFDMLHMRECSPQSTSIGRLFLEESGAFIRSNPENSSVMAGAAKLLQKYASLC